MLTIKISQSKKLANLAKNYTNDTKYSGCNDSFTLELAIFHNIYLRPNVPPETKMKAFFTMLKDFMIDYSNISTSVVALNFDQVYNSIRNYFEEAEYK